MTAIRIIDDHIQLASIGSKTHAQIEGHIQGIGNYAFPAADGGANKILKTDGAGVLSWIDRFTCSDLSACSLNNLGTRPHSQLTGIGANDHHAESHSVVSHSDTTATGAELEILTDNSIANALHRHSELVASDGSPDPALDADAAGRIRIGGATASPRKLQIYDSSKSGIQIEGHSTADDVVTLGFRWDWKDATIARFYWIGSQNSPENVFDDTFRLQMYTGAAWLRPIVFHKNGDIKFYNAGAIIKVGGQMGLGTVSPATSAKLELSSTTGALLLSRMTTTQKNALTAVNGMVLYDSTLNKFQGYENGSWTNLI